jgi:hypothetical protein
VCTGDAINDRMIQNEFARRNDRLISKWVFRFGLAVCTVLFVAARVAFATPTQTETEIAGQANSSGSLIFGNREQAEINDREGANHFLHQSELRSGRPSGKLFRRPAWFLQIRRKAIPLKLVISLQTSTIVYRTATPEELLAQSVRIWCTIHETTRE